MNNQFAKRLKELREECKMSRTELAEKVNVSQRLICYWENAQRECDFDMLITLAEIFDVSTDVLLGKTEY